VDLASPAIANPTGARVSAIAVEGTDSIADCFARRVAATPTACAYRDFDAASGTWREIDWRGVDAQVARVSAALSREGLAAGERVAIMARNCREWVFFDQAAMALGLVVVPIFSDDRPENVAYILNDSEARVVMVEGAEQCAKLAEVGDRIAGVKRIVCAKVKPQECEARVVALEEWLRDAGTAPARVKVDGDALATIVYTSGTTGKPKGVMLSHQNMLSNVKGGLAVYRIFPDDVFLSFLPLSHMLERTAGYYLTMVAGSTVAFARSIAQLGDDFKSVRPTIIVSVPRIFEKLHGQVTATLQSASPARKRMFEIAHRVGWDRFEWKQGRGPWKASFLAWPLLEALVASKLLARLGGRLRLCISGGAALNPQIAHTFIGLGLPICQGYGLTEAAPVVSVNHLDRNDPASIGMPLPGIEIAFGERDVLLVRGPNVMQGYWKNPEATAKVKSADGWLDTGDQAALRDGFLYITGRIKDIIVLGNGEKVPPVDMELAIQLDPLFEQAMVLGEGKPFLAALLVLDPRESARAGPLDDKALAARVGAQLKDFPGYAQIRRVALVDEPWTVDNGLLTPTLKLKRAPILERFKEKVDEMYKGR
jgi:long-chain acyl-CoA synthetase